jgi:hypothetical protein
VGSLVNAAVSGDAGTNDAGTNAAESAAGVPTLLGFVLGMSLGFSILAVVDAEPRNASPGLFWYRLVGTMVDAIIAIAMIVPLYNVWRKQFR